MQIFILLLMLSYQQMMVFASPTGELSLLAEIATSLVEDTNIKGFECGNIFFSDSEVDQVLELGLEYADSHFQFPQRYRGPLYSDARTTEYLLWPIRKDRRILPHSKDHFTSYRVVYTKSGKKVIDVISMITNNEFTKCIRRDSSQAEQSVKISEETNGYQCGYEFLSDNKVQESLILARSKIGEDGEYPALYTGNLFPENRGYLIWPILDGKTLLKAGHVFAGSYFLVISREGEFIETVVRGFNKNFLRCTRSRKFPKAPASDQYSNLFVPAPSFGYQCGKTFFGDQKLEDAAELAKSNTVNKFDDRFPYEYNGHPFYEPFLVWPIQRNGNLYKRGRIFLFLRMVLTLDYKVKCVAIVDAGEMKECERKTIRGKKNHDLSDYLCGRRLFTHEQLERAVEQSCKKMKIARFQSYPRKYEGPRFEKDGPYFTFPVFQTSIFTSNPGLDRVVMNSSCEIVGALTTLEENSEKRLFKCYRLSDGQIKKGFFKYQDPISEHRIKY